MKNVRVGVIGTGHIGTEHVDRLMTLVNGSEVVAVTDISKEAAQHVLDKYPTIKFYSTAEELIHATEVDAVVVTCINNLHAPYVLLAVEAGKPVFCEKPLGNTADEIRKIMEAEEKTGKHLVNVGFMRRFDSGYQAMKSEIRSAGMGHPCISYCTHRNVGDWVGRITDMDNARTVVGTAIHEIDVMSWLFDDPFVSAEIIYGKDADYTKAYDGFRDPYILCMKTQSGIAVLLEVSMHCEFGYDIQCSVVFERGVAQMPTPSCIEKKFASQKTSQLETTWKNRFREAFDKEMQAWIDSILTGKPRDVATTWDGYRAAVMADACIRAFSSGKTEICNLPKRPAFYDDLYLK